MPLFEYVCVKCNTTTESLQPKLVENSIITCPKCDGVAKLSDVNRTSFRLRPGGAGGFYNPSRM